MPNRPIRPEVNDEQNFHQRSYKTVESTNEISETIEEFDVETGHLKKRTTRTESQKSSSAEQTTTDASAETPAQPILPAAAQRIDGPGDDLQENFPVQVLLSMFPDARGTSRDYDSFWGDHILSVTSSRANSVTWTKSIPSDKGSSLLTVTAIKHVAQLSLVARIEGAVAGLEWSGNSDAGFEESVRLFRNPKTLQLGRDDDWPDAIELQAIDNARMMAPAASPQSGLPVWDAGQSGETPRQRYAISADPNSTEMAMMSFRAGSGSSGGGDTPIPDKPEFPECPSGDCCPPPSPVSFPPTFRQMDGGCTSGGCSPIRVNGSPPVLSSFPVKYSSGTIQFAETDIESTGYGFPWGHTRSFASRQTSNASLGNGFNWQVREWVYLSYERTNGEITTIVVQGVAGNTVWFDKVGSGFAARFGLKNTLTHDADNNEYVLNNPDGSVIEFKASNGALRRRVDPGGTAVEVTSYSADGFNPATVERSFTSDSDTITEQFLYEYNSSSILPLLQSVTLRQRVNAEAWTNVLRANYAYYNGTEDYGLEGDLKTVTTQEWTNSSWSDTGTSYYRYETPDLLSGGAPNPKAHLLRYALNKLAFERLQADPSVSDPFTASDEIVGQYADFYYEYDDERRCTLEKVQGGSMTFEYAYSESTNPAGVNSWKNKTVETRPDNSTFTVFSNEAGQTMLSELKEGSDTWLSFYKYNSDNRLILQATPAAITGYDETKADLLDYDPGSGTYAYLRDHAGLIRLSTYDPNSGYKTSESIQQGQLGTVIKLTQTTYSACPEPGHGNFYVVSQQTDYPSDSNQSETIVTSYAYTWYAGTSQIKQMTTTLPVIAASQNGSGIASTRREYFDTHGYNTWSMDERGFISRMVYDIPTGAIVRQIQDVDTDIETDHPTGWVTPSGGGLNLVSDFEHDDRGRITQSLGPAHQIDLGGAPTTVRTANWIVYEATASANITRTAQGYATGSAPSYTYTLVNPVSISVVDKNGNIREQIQATRASTSGKLLPSDTFTQSSYTRWHTYQYTECCQVHSERSYFDIPTTGVGLKSVNYAETSYRYDDMKRRIATISPGGTISRVVYGPRSLVLSNWIGTNDSGATPTDPTGGGATGNNMVVVSANQYDGGQPGGNGNLTQQTSHVNSSDTRVTSFTYDFRNRRTTTDGELDYFEKTYYDNLNRVIKTERYNTDENGNLLARSETLYDDFNRVYRTLQYGVDPSTGQLEGGTLEDNNFYDAAGNLLKVEPSDIELYREFAYDSLNRVVSETDPRDAETTFTYDANSQRLTLTDAEGNTTTWGYDGVGRVIQETNELDESRHFTYASSGELASKTDRNGRVTEYTYDDMGRNTSEIWKESSTTVNTITHSYNIESQPLTSSDVASGLVYTYDGLGRMATASNAGTTGVPEVVLTLTHNRLNERTDLAAQIDKENTPDFANSYLHDKLGRISRITQTGQTSGNAVADKRADFTFGSLGYNSGISRYENLSTSNLVASTTLNYDPFARLVGQSHVKDANPLGSYSVTYDANRRIDSMTTPDGLGEFDYDGSGQLLEADYDYQSDEDFTYDLTGNRTMTGYTTGPNNQLLTAGDLEFEYDGEGNRIKQTDTATDDYVEYTWDHRNRLTKVTFFDDTDTKTKEILYSYDTHNRRIRRQLDANGNGTIDSAQNIVYDADWKPGLEDIVLIFDESDDLQHRFLHGPGIDQPLADEQPAKLHWLLPGQIGTITDVIEYTPGTDTTTNINHLTYTSFGQIASQTNSAHEPYYTYTAREWDGDAELYYYRARWYDPVVGRFVSEDPIGYASLDINLFRYVVNSPMIFSDNTGLNPDCATAFPPPAGIVGKPSDYKDCLKFLNDIKKLRNCLIEKGYNNLKKNSRNWFAQILCCETIANDKVFVDPCNCGGKGACHNPVEMEQADVLNVFGCDNNWNRCEACCDYQSCMYMFTKASSGGTFWDAFTGTSQALKYSQCTDNICKP